MERNTWVKTRKCDTSACVEVYWGTYNVLVRNSAIADGPTLIFTPDEWDAFINGAKDGEFDLKKR